MWGLRKGGVACVRARRVLRDQRAMHWQEASRGSGSFSTGPDLRLGCDLWALPEGVAGLGRGEEAGSRRCGCSLDAEGWAAASLSCLQHPDQVLKAGFSSPLAPLGFLLPCVFLLLFFPRRAAALLLTLSLQALGLPDAGLPWSCLSPSQVLLLLFGSGIPFPGVASAAHLHPPYFVLSTLMSWDSS